MGVTCATISPFAVQAESLRKATVSEAQGGAGPGKDRWM